MKKLRTSAFTLIELLTVIAIIGILAAILIPVVGAVRESARNSQCISNLRQVGMAIVAASDDFNGRFPGSLRNYQVKGSHEQPFLSGLMATLEPYLDQQIRDGFTGSPAASHAEGVWRCESSGIPRPVQWPYYPNGAIWTGPAPGTSLYQNYGRALDSIPELTRFPVVADRGWTGPGLNDGWGHWGGNGQMFRPGRGWHSGERLNVAFGDASVRSFAYRGPTDTSSEFGEILTEAATWIE